jgi:hypothetical protein
MPAGQTHVWLFLLLTSVSKHVGCVKPSIVAQTYWRSRGEQQAAEKKLLHMPVDFIAHAHAHAFFEFL